MSAPSVDDEPLHVLVVCTANACRSPVAERLLGRHLSVRKVAAEIHSAGVRGGRLAVHADTLRAAQEFDLDVRDHVSRLLTPDLIPTDGADFVIGLTREHLREVVALDPTAWPRTFTLKELARRSYEVGPAGSVREWIAAASAGRKAADLMTPSPDDDLDDPYGGAASGHAEMVAEVDALTERIAVAVAATS